MLKVKNMEEFSNEIERLVNDKQMMYIEAIIENLKIYEIEYDNSKIKNLLSPKLQQKLYEEACDYNMLGRKKRKKFRRKTEKK